MVIFLASPFVKRLERISCFPHFCLHSQQITFSRRVIDPGPALALKIVLSPVHECIFESHVGTIGTIIHGTFHDSRDQVNGNAGQARFWHVGRSVDPLL